MEVRGLVPAHWDCGTSLGVGMGSVLSVGAEHRDQQPKRYVGGNLS